MESFWLRSHSDTKSCELHVELQVICEVVDLIQFSELHVERGRRATLEFASNENVFLRDWDIRIGQTCSSVEVDDLHHRALSKLELNAWVVEKLKKACSFLGELSDYSDHLSLINHLTSLETECLKVHVNPVKLLKTILDVRILPDLV